MPMLWLQYHCRSDSNVRSSRQPLVASLLLCRGSRMQQNLLVPPSRPGRSRSPPTLPALQRCQLDRLSRPQRKPAMTAVMEPAAVAIVTRRCRTPNDAASRAMMACRVPCRAAMTATRTQAAAWKGRVQCRSSHVMMGWQRLSVPMGLAQAQPSAAGTLRSLHQPLGMSCRRFVRRTAARAWCRQIWCCMLSMLQQMLSLQSSSVYAFKMHSWPSVPETMLS
mmetsp:Transcript_20271/g.61084  ORF Transcript_20271/g.61084 Transcript_20271/m.61084 type:complete len:222 (-) Transcript_20271:1153-1818(-)